MLWRYNRSKIVSPNFVSGVLVPASGLYGVLHATHRLVATVALFKGEPFPKCSACDGPIVFTLVRGIPALDTFAHLEIRMALAELSPIEDDERG